VRETDLDTDNGKMVVNYEGWVENFKDAGAVKEVKFTSRAWKYVWPNFALTKRILYHYAPTTITLKAVQLGSKVPLDAPVYTWSIPTDGINILKENKETIRVFEVNKAGTYNFSFKVDDDRGNTKTRQIEVIVKDPPAYAVDAYFSKSNAFDRAPLSLFTRALARGGHPADRIDDIIFKVDGEVVEDRGSYSRTTLDEGDHTMTIEVVSRMGQNASKDFPITVKANKAPTCELVEKEYSSTWSYTAVCKDEDGKLKKYKWLINGVDPGRSSVRMSVPKSQFDTVPPVQLIGIDDAGAESPPATN
jgi:hypothetical protein